MSCANGRHFGATCTKGRQPVCFTINWHTLVLFVKHTYPSPPYSSLPPSSAPPPSPTFWTAPPPLTIQLFQSRLTLCIAEYRDGSELWVVLRAAACVNQVLNLFLRFQQSGVFRRYFHFYSLIELMWKLYCTINTCKYDSHFVLHSLCT